MLFTPEKIFHPSFSLLREFFAYFASSYIYSQLSVEKRHI